MFPRVPIILQNPNNPNNFYFSHFSFMKKFLLIPVLILSFSFSSAFASISENNSSIRNLENTCKTYNTSVSKYLSTVLPLYLDSSVTNNNQEVISQYTKSIEALSQDKLAEEMVQYSYELKKLPPLTQLLFRSLLNVKNANEVQGLTTTSDSIKSFILSNDTLLKFCNNFPQYKSKVLAEKENGYIAMYQNEMNTYTKDMKDLMRAQNLEQVKLKNKKFSATIKKDMNLKLYKLIQLIKESSNRSK